MMRVKLIGIATLLVVTSAGGATMLHNTGETSTGKSTDAKTSVILAQASPPASSGSSGDSGKRPVSLTEAVRLAEQHTGGRAREVEHERAKNAEVYEVKVIAKDGPKKVIVDVASGSINRVEGKDFWDKIEDIFDDEDRREEAEMLKALETAKATLLGAIEAAQANVGGQTTEAELKKRHGKMKFEMQVLVDGTMRTVTVDPATADLVVKPARRNGDDDDDDRDEDD